MMPTGLTTQYPLISNHLQNAGYSTHAVGKWHLGYCSWDYTPTRRGFDSFFGFYSHGEDYYNRVTQDSTDMFSGYDLRENEAVSFKGSGRYSANVFSDQAVKVIEDHKAGQPLFLYLAYQNVHKPIQVPDHYARKYQPYGKLTKESMRQGMISALDEGIGNVTKALKKAKMYEDTVIIFLSDNGGYTRASNWPLRGKKNSVHEGGTRTVSLFHYPRVNPKLQGRVSENMIHVVDWLPTILALAGGQANTTFLDGMDQSLHLTAGWPGPRNELVYNINDALRITAAVRVGRFKLIWGYADGLTSDTTRKQTKNKYLQTLYEANEAKMVYLYDLKKDPNETTNLAYKKKRLTKFLKEKIKSILQSGNVVPPDAPRPKYRSLPRFYGGVVSPGWCHAH
ncbi:arylsulfatase I [Eurytemora carolleeae]|uniref:arylsulfatase I n=1 Tax=Eurytemora carolleeae TaxID=1294199 RepID=UPI000C76AF61|nr:arylsulfatase I [Eurytemora carolleeae]|eukprot:XP_023345276.1 arylsulfatase I-like [Eurytemora affinis]